MNISEKALLLSGWIDEAQCITCVCHARPDGDAAGSCTAMTGYLRKCRSKDAVSVYPDAAPDSLGFVTSLSPHITADTDLSRAKARIGSTDLLICLDFNTLSRAEGLEEDLRSAHCRKVLIDHHQSPVLSDFDLCFSNTDVSSACELLYSVLMLMPDVNADASRLPSESAEALMTGMTTDTNNFANSVFPGTFRMASDLLACGVDRNALIDKLYFCERPNRLAAQGEMLSTHMKILPCGAAVTVLHKDFYERHALMDGETEGFVNLPLAVKDVRLSILVKEEESGKMRVSLRSKAGVSARRLAAECFHGGGHEQASGGKILIPEDIKSPGEADAYVADVAARFMQDNYTED